MKLLLLTCAIALASAAPSDRVKRDVLPGDSRYNAAEARDSHEYHANEAEIARALSSNSGCLSLLAYARGFGGLKSETPVGSTDSVKNEVNTGAVESYGAETAGSVQAVEQPADSSLTYVKEEPISSIKADAAVDTSSTATQAETPVAVPEPATSDVKDPQWEEKAQPEAEYASPAETPAKTEVSASDVEQKPELAKPEVNDAQYEKETKYETKSGSPADTPVEAQVQYFVPAVKFVGYQVAVSQPEQEIKFETKSASPASDVAEAQVASPESFVPAVKSAESPAAVSQPQQETKFETKSASPASDAAQVASPESFVPAVKSVESPAAISQPEQETKFETKSASPASDAAQVASPESFVPAVKSVESPATISQPEQETKFETKSGSPASDAAEVQVASPESFVPAVKSVESPAAISQPEQETKFETKSASPASDAAQVASPESFAPAVKSAESPAAVSQPQQETKFESRSGIAADDVAEAPVGSTSQSADPSESANAQPAIEAKSSAITPESESKPATDSSAASSPLKFGSPAGYPFSPGFRSPVLPAYPAAPLGVSPLYTPGLNAFEHGRYNPNLHSGYGYTPGFGGYNGNYARLGEYYPGHPLGFGAHPVLDQSLKGKTVISPAVPVGFPHTFPLDYSKNVPFVHPQPYHQYRAGYPVPHPIAPFPAIQQTINAEKSGEQTSQIQQQFAKYFPTPNAWAQPTAASYVQPAETSATKSTQ